MNKIEFDKCSKELFAKYDALVGRKNERMESNNNIYWRYKFPIITADHIPPHWRFDLNYKTNPHLLQRIGVNATLNSGAILFKGRFLMIVRVEGWDRKSYFAMAESPNGIDQWRFWDSPVILPDRYPEETNVYDMRLTQHEDGWIYGLFCSESKDPNAAPGDLSSAYAKAGIVRTKDMINWERLPNIQSKYQQRNVVLHPEFINGKYALYTRPAEGFMDSAGGGIGWALAENMDNVVIEEEIIIEPRAYHTIKEMKNGQGPAPIKTEKGWLHLAHGVRGCASGLRYVLYLFMTDLKEPWKVIATPGGYFMAPEGEERIGDVSNVLFANGWVVKEDGEVYIYYGSSDTRMHVAVSTVEKLIDYCMHTPVDGLRSQASVQNINKLIVNNRSVMQ